MRSLVLAEHIGLAYEHTLVEFDPHLCWKSPLLRWRSWRPVDHWESCCYGRAVQPVTFTVPSRRRYVGCLRFVSHRTLGNSCEPPELPGGECGLGLIDRYTIHRRYIPLIERDRHRD